MQTDEVIVLVMFITSVIVMLIPLGLLIKLMIEDKRRSVQLEDELEDNRRLLYMQ